MRIDKMLSQLKYGSRQDIKKMAKKGYIKLNQSIVYDVSMHIDPEVDVLSVKDEQVIYIKQFILKLYKPIGYVSSSQDSNYPSLFDLIDMPYQRYPLKIAGRLDVDTEGLVLITNDGNLQHEITHPKKHLEKHYEATLDKPFLHNATLLKGITIKDGNNQPFIAKALSLQSEGNYVKITIDEGKFHQIKRMFQALDYKVTHLKRTQIGTISLDLLKPGEYQEVSLKEYHDRYHY